MGWTLYRAIQFSIDEKVGAYTSNTTINTNKGSSMQKVEIETNVHKRVTHMADELNMSIDVFVKQALETHVAFQNDLCKKEDEEIAQMLLKRGAIKENKSSKRHRTSK